MKKPCQVSGCRRNAQTSRKMPHFAYCSWHRQRRRLYGHVKGRAIRAGEYRAHEKMAKKFYYANVSGRATKIALDLMAQILTAGPEPMHSETSDRWQSWRELERLRRADVGAEEALIRLLGFLIYAEEQPARVPGDIRYTFALARSILTLAPAEIVRSTWLHDEQRQKVSTRAPGSKACRIIGTRIQQQLGLYLLTAARFILKNEQERRNQKFNPMKDALKEEQFA